MTVSVGDKAPAFVATGTSVGAGQRTYESTEFVGRPLVLVFYPGDATAVCTEQLTSYNDSLDTLRDLKAEVLALSPQDIESHEQFSSKHDFQFPLLFDEGKKIGELYNVVGPLGFYRRSVFVIDSQGVVVYAKRARAGLTYPKIDEIAAVIPQ